MSASPEVSRPAPSGQPDRRKYPSDGTRVERRRRQRTLGEKRREALEYAQRLQFLVDLGPDDETKRELRKVIRGIRIRFAREENEQRFAVLRALESSQLSTLDDVVAKTGLPADCVQKILDDFASARVDLVCITTMGGKRNCGRKGTTLYYGLNR